MSSVALLMALCVALYVAIDDDGSLWVATALLAALGLLLALCLALVAWGGLQ